MSKVSIGLRGWRFEESELFDDSGEFRPLTEMAPDIRDRLARLMVVVNDPCDCCWLEHGEQNKQRCRPASVVYGEPLHEVVLCTAHEADFLYWFREEDGNLLAGESTFDSAFHQWFADGGRAPDEYGGLEHVDTDPEEVPTPTPAEELAPIEDELATLDDDTLSDLDIDLDDLDI